jgi:precorrin-6B methylase 1
VNRGNLKTAVGFDLDSSLANTRHRWHLAPAAEPGADWEPYCAARMGDMPFPGPAAAARLHYPAHQVHIFSGSSASSEAVTRQWLSLHRIPFDGLRQRARGDRRENADIKVGYIEDLRESGILMVLYYEDHPDVATEIYERTGVPVVILNPCYPEDEERFRRQSIDAAGGGL